MYHGSKTLITDGYLEPKVSFACKPFVYATDDYYYALVRSGNFDMTKFLVREDYQGKDKPYQLVELIPGAFEELFNRSGYIYEVDDKDFIASNDVNEFVSENKVQIRNVQFVEDIWSEMMKHSDKYELIRFEDSSEFWKTVSGGYKGYMNRKFKRLRKVIEAGAR